MNTVSKLIAYYTHIDTHEIQYIYTNLGRTPTHFRSGLVITGHLALLLQLIRLLSNSENNDIDRALAHDDYL